MACLGHFCSILFKNFYAIVEKKHKVKIDPEIDLKLRWQPMLYFCSNFKLNQVEASK